MAYNELKNWFTDNLTILKWLPSYGKSSFQKDLLAGLTVGVMIIPQAMAYAVLAGVPPIYGLYASVIPLLIYPFFGTSRHLSVGVVAIDMLVVSAGVGLIAPQNTPEFIGLVVLLSCFVGLIQIAMSVARLGVIVNLLSRPVIVGFTAAAPLIISASQLGGLLGVELVQSQHIYTLLYDLFGKLSEIDFVTSVIGIGSLIVLVLVKSYYPVAPEALIIVVFSTLIVWMTGLGPQNIQLVGEVPAGIPHVAFPAIELDNLRRLLPTAITLALIQFMNMVSLGRTFASKYHYTISPNRELFAIGTANFLGGIFRGIPVSASFSRSAINEQAGAQSPLSNAVVGLLVFISLFILTPLFYYIPIAALSAIIITAAVSLIDLEEVKYLFRTKERDGYIAIFTFVTTLLVGIQEGILLGVAASLVAVLMRASRPNVAVLGHLKGSRNFRDIERFPDASQIEDILILRVDASFSFNNAEYFKEFILQKSEKEQRPIKAVIIDGISINDLDTTAIEALEIVVQSLHDLDIDLHFAGLKGPIRDIMMRSGLARKLGGTHFHMSPHQAVKYILEKWSEKDDEDQRYQSYMEDID